MQPEIFVSLIIEDDIKTGKFLETLFENSVVFSWEKGQLKKDTLATYKKNGCAFKANPISTLSVGFALKHFFKSFQLDEFSIFSEAVKTYGLSPILSIAIYCDEIMPSIDLASSTIRKLAQNNISVDIDIILTEARSFN